MADLRRYAYYELGAPRQLRYTLDSGDLGESVLPQIYLVGRLLLCAVALFSINTLASPKGVFESEVLPVFEKRCLACHGQSPYQGELNLRTIDGLLKGGKSGPAVVPGSPDNSLLLAKIVGGSMPPIEPKLTVEEVGKIRDWIDHGIAQEQASAGPPVTDKEVVPIFQLRCAKCHGKRRTEGELDLRTLASRMKGGKSGPALVPGKPDESLLFQRITKGEMPPPDLLFESQVRPPNEAEVEILRKWIAGGALPAPEEPAAQGSDHLIKDEDREFWAFQSPSRPALPKVKNEQQVRNPIDAFLLASLEKKNLSFSPEASDLTLLRRAHLDLTGMPPTPQEIDEFREDDQPGAYERLIDRLLDSGHYGERWAQIWLDLAGYADSEGVIDEDRPRKYSWRYRDYVIRAFNSDKPYDRFLHEQLAGDELIDYENVEEVTQEVVDTLAATGFLRLTPDGTYGAATGSLAERMTVISDEMHVLSSSLMGLTVGCARCHDHKYDPLPQRDYYRLSAIFQTALDPYDWVVPTERHLEVGLASEREASAKFNAPLEEEVRRLKTAFDGIVTPRYETELEKRLSELPEDLREDLRTVAATPKKERTSIQKYLARQFKEVLQVPNADGEWHQIAEAFPEIKEEAGKINKEISALKARMWPEPKIRALYDMGGDPSPAYVLQRGAAQSIGERVYPGVPAIFSGKLVSYEAAPPRDAAKTSGNRLAFARWLTQPDHPLTARVMVNRLWLNHFQRGLVATPANFGRTGSPPSHPELLDWLATEFVRSGWSIKAMHRLMMTSAAYRQTSRVDAKAQAADPENILLSRMPLRRMDAEVLHDSILRVTERADLASFGRPVPVTKKDSGEIVADATEDGWRRAIYVMKRRRTPMSMLEAFDAPQLTPNCTERAESTVAPQALQLMNSPLVLEHARYLAGRLIDHFADDRKGQIDRLYWQVLSRPPSPQEIDLALTDLADLERHWMPHLARTRHNGPRKAAAEWMALGSLAHGLLNSPEFVYID